MRERVRAESHRKKKKGEKESAERREKKGENRTEEKKEGRERENM